MPKKQAKAPVTVESVARSLCEAIEEFFDEWTSEENEAMESDEAGKVDRLARKLLKVLDERGK